MNVKRRVLILAVCALGLVSVLIYYLRSLNALTGGPAHLRRYPYKQCADNFHQLGMTIKYYHDAFGAYPPRVYSNDSGVPMHTWRFFLLPFTDYNYDLSEYNLEQPWDSDDNRYLGHFGLPIYQCPDDSSKSETKGYTSYFYLTDYCDKTRVVLVRMHHGAGIEWSNPTDLSLNHLKVLLHKGFRSAGRHEPGGLAVIRRDCRVFRLYATNVDDYIREIERTVRLTTDP